MRDCEAFLGAPHEDVNRWMDEFFATAGSKHRKFRHHWEGIREARTLFGEEGAKAATIHILRDCRNIPSAEDYETGAADQLGLVASWPASAYVHYTEEAFTALVKYKIEGPMAVVLWVFLKNEAELANLLSAVSRFPDDERAKLLHNWSQAVARLEELNKNPIQETSVREVDGAIAEWCNQQAPFYGPLLAQIPKARFAMVPTEQLITPLTMIDYEYVEELKATLTGTDPRDIARFALPDQIQVQVKTQFDPSGRAVMFVSPQKSLVLGPMTVNPVPGVGMEVKMLIMGTPQLILVSHVAGRLYLRSGIHRAYLLASLGVKEIPCILAEEEQIPQVVGAYPTFAPHVLAMPRPPLLRDALDPTLTLLVPLLRTNKIFRIAAEEFIVPAN
jgi:hypothetical protein